MARKIASSQQERLKSSENNYDWLGHGQYFWEDSWERALLWARQAAERPNSRIKNPGVLGAIIDLGACLNLIDSQYTELVIQAYAELLRVTSHSGEDMPRNSGPGLGARRLDCAVLEALHQFRQDRGLPPFDTVRAFFVEGEPLYPNAGLRHRDHIQICVRRPEAIVGYFLPRQPGALF